MIRRSASFWIVVTVLLLVGLSTSSALAQCNVFMVERPDDVRSGRSLSIRLFAIKAPPNYKGEPVENLRIALAEKLRDTLQASKYFSSVIVLPEDKRPQTDLVLEGEFTNIDEGSRAGRMLIGSGAAQMGVQGRLMATNPSGRVFEFLCYRASAGFFGTGGG